MKKILSLILTFILVASIFTSCNENIESSGTQEYTDEQSESLTEKQTNKETTKKETTKKETTKKETTKKETEKTYSESTAGLLFELNSDGNGYILTDTGNAKEIVIDGHKGLPVTELGGWLFYENKKFL